MLSILREFEMFLKTMFFHDFHDLEISRSMIWSKSMFEQILGFWVTGLQDPVFELLKCPYPSQFLKKDDRFLEPKPCNPRILGLQTFPRCSKSWDLKIQDLVQIHVWEDSRILGYKVTRYRFWEPIMHVTFAFLPQDDLILAPKACNPEYVGLQESGAQRSWKSSSDEFHRKDKLRTGEGGHTRRSSAPLIIKSIIFG